jgi:hypothetical protein
MQWPRPIGQLSEMLSSRAMAETPASALGVADALDCASSTTWPDELWAGSITLLDAILRGYYGIYEFTDDPACLFRVGFSRARAPVSLEDGTRIEAGEVIGTLHFWNEHLPRYSATGPDLCWARAMRDQVVHSLSALADHIETEPAWRGVRALRGEAALSARLGRSQVRRVVERFGYECVPTDSSLFRRLHSLGDSFILWALTRAFNPAALPRQPFLRDHHDLWMSRTTLLLRYSRRRTRLPTETARPRQL